VSMSEVSLSFGNDSAAGRMWGNLSGSPPLVLPARAAVPPRDELGSLSSVGRRHEPCKIPYHRRFELQETP
jgi:hypothetical protein